MPLNWNIEKCKRNKADQWKEGELFFACSLTMIVGIPEIADEDAARRFYNRLNAYEKLHGAFRGEADEDGTTTESFMRFEEVQQWIGLKTNVIEYTPHIFGRHLLKRLKDTW